MDFKALKTIGYSLIAHFVQRGIDRIEVLSYITWFDNRAAVTGPRRVHSLILDWLRLPVPANPQNGSPNEKDWVTTAMEDPSQTFQVSGLH